MTEEKKTHWAQIKELLSDNMSLIPVRDKDEGNFIAKTPYSGWKENQTKRMSEGQLFDMMGKKDTKAVAVVCGEVSGNLECIDIDSKYYEGISIKLFTEIKSLRPDLYDVIRVHRTPSGGYHIIYRIEDHAAERNQKLAGRYKTEEELNSTKGKTVNFLETRGEGGFFLYPPSTGYKVHLDRPIPLITWEDRNDLISICRSFNEIVKEAKITPKPSKAKNTPYLESPFEDFNARGDIQEIIKEQGWTVLPNRSNDKLYFTRPGKKDGVSAALFTETNKLYVFTSSTDLESETAYSACDLLIKYRFNDSLSDAAKWLTDNGYGKVKPKVEQSIIKRALTNGNDIPANLSDGAKKTFEDLKVKITAKMPFGIFWGYDEGKYVISREDLYDVSDKLGYKLFNGVDLVKIDGAVISHKEDKEYFDEIKNYIWDEDEDELVSIKNSYEKFIQNSGKFTISRLKEVNKEIIMQDEKDHAYKFYKNGFIKITKNGHEFFTYDDIDGLVWEHKVNNRDWCEDCKKSDLFESYLNNAVGLDSYAKKIVGYLAHDHKQESSGYIIVLTEKVADPKDGGGSGKNVFGNMFRYTNTVKTVPGSQVKFDENFLQPWTHERVYFLADIPKKIDWAFLKEMATGSGIHKRLYKDQVEIQSEDMPKLLLNTNFSFDDSDGGLIRRIRQLEFEDYYTVNGGVDVVHGKMFPGDFNREDWVGYDHLIKDCLVELFKADGKIEKSELSEVGWTKKFHMQYGESTYDFFEDNISRWKQIGFIPNRDIIAEHVNMCNEIDVPPKYRLSSKSLSSALKSYCDKKNILIDVSFLKRFAGKVERGKMFLDKNSEQEFDF